MILAQRVARVLLPPAALLGLALVCWLGGLVWFAQTIPREDGWADRATDAIVVLTGGSERISTGVQLLSRGLGRTLFVSGVHQGVDLRDMLRAARLEPSTLECCIVLGYEAGDTVGNAAETAAWMRSRSYESLRLVTSNYHMRRSLLEFGMAMPQVDAAAVRGRIVGLVTAPGGRGQIAAELVARGARVVRADVYVRDPLPLDTAAIAQLLDTGDAPLLLPLTSGEALQRVLEALPGPAARRLRSARVVAASERLADLARASGFAHARAAHSPQPEALLAAAMALP